MHTSDYEPSNKETRYCLYVLPAGKTTYALKVKVVLVIASCFKFVYN